MEANDGGEIKKGNKDKNGGNLRPVFLNTENAQGDRCEYEKIEGYNFYQKCPVCGQAALWPQMGCVVCDSCGYSRCD